MIQGEYTNFRVNHLVIQIKIFILTELLLFKTVTGFTFSPSLRTIPKPGSPHNHSPRHCAAYCIPLQIMNILFCHFHAHCISDINSLIKVSPKIFPLFQASSSLSRHPLPSFLSQCLSFLFHFCQMYFSKAPPRVSSLLAFHTRLLGADNWKPAERRSYIRNAAILVLGNVDSLALLIVVVTSVVLHTMPLAFCSTACATIPSTTTKPLPRGHPHTCHCRLDWVPWVP